MRLGEIVICRPVYDSNSNIMFRVAAQNHYGDGITTLLADRVIGVRALDAAEGGSKGKYPYEASDKYGNNNYIDSNLHQWLNSAEKDWFKPAHERDNPPVSEHLRYGEYPYLDTPGFLTEFSEHFRKGLIETDIPVLVRTKRGEGELNHVKASVFLPSRTEMNKGDECGIAEGKTLPIFYDHYIFKAKPSDEQIALHGRDWNREEPEKNLFFDTPHMYDPKFGWWYYMRTPNLLYKFMVRVISPYGSVSYTYAYNDIVGLRPLINLSSSLIVEDDGAQRPQYCIVG